MVETITFTAMLSADAATVNDARWTGGRSFAQGKTLKTLSQL